MGGDAAFALMTMGHVAQIISPPKVVAGKRGEAELSAPDVPCWPLDPVTTTTIQRLGLESPARLRQTVVEGQVLFKRGSYLLLDGLPKRYPIQYALPHDWSGPGEMFTLLVVEALEA